MGAWNNQIIPEWTHVGKEQVSDVQACAFSSDSATATALSPRYEAARSSRSTLDLAQL